MIEILKAKIHRVTITEIDLHYDGSITVDRDLLDRAGMRPFEAVEVYNINSGTRFKTYLIEGNRGSGCIGINGAAARLGAVGDLVIIVAYRYIEEGSPIPEPVVVLVDERNHPL
jgi:aspartate 1-decarboxylase